MKKLLLLFTFLSLTTGIFSQVTKTVNLVTAGTLSTSLTSNELNTITNLTLTGTIDARDFKTMRDDMSLLAVLDLSGVTIAAYSGSEGPSWNTNYAANTIPEYAFENRLKLQSKISLISVVLPSSVTSIGGSAFYGCRGLTTVTIPSSVVEIENYAFMGCIGLTTVTIPSSVTSIRMRVFEDCIGLTTVTIPSSVTSIGNGAFANCRGLTTVTIPSSVTTIGIVAFKNCSGLATVAIPSSVTSIRDGAFAACSGLITVDSNNPIYSSLDGILYNKAQTTLIQCPISKVGSFTIPSSVTSIGGSAFYGCSGLTIVTIPSSVTSIGDGAFAVFSGLITVDSNNPIYSSLDGILYNNAQTTLIQCPISKVGSFTIPSSVTSIGNSAFGGCTRLTTVIPSSITSLGDFAFYGCSELNTVTIPSSVTYIGYAAFYNCSGLTSITTPRLIPLELREATDVFLRVDKTTCTLYVPFGSKSAYQTAPQWKDFKNIVEKDLTVTSPEINNQTLTIYPNPTTGKIKIVFAQIPIKGSTLTVNDFTGKTILTQHIQNKEEQIDLEGNSPGVYLIRTNMKDFKVQKVILK